MVPFARESQRIMLAILVGFIVIAIGAFQWAVIMPDSLNTRDDNPRAVERERRIVRGDIYSADGLLLAHTDVNDAGIVTRQYPVAEAWPSLGYYSMVRGAARIEGAFDTILRGDNAEAALSNRLLHTPIQGTSIRVTLDSAVQRMVSERLDGQAGAAVAISIPDGRLLGISSAPFFDPNAIDADYESLREDPAMQLLDRATERRYPLGTAIQPVLMIASLLTGQPLDAMIDNATEPVDLSDTLSIGCAVRLPALSLTLREAFAFACPTPFIGATNAVGETAMNTIFEQVDALTAVRISGYESASPAAQIRGYNPIEGMEAVVTGQADLTVTPLAMAILTGAIVNDGNTPVPFMLDATLAPGAGAWADAPRPNRTVAFTTATTARRLQDLMRYNVVNGAAQNAARPNIDIGGHVGLAYVEGRPMSWFIGFVTASGRQAGAVAVLLEDTSDIGLAADIGGDILAAVHASLLSESP